MAKAVKEKWFSAGKPTGWRKDMSATQRRKIALKSRKGDTLATARALQSLANVSTDKQTKKLARADAAYFFDLHRRGK